MSPTKVLVAMVVGLTAAACSSSYQTQASAPYRVPNSEQACLDYGFRPGTDAYNRCVVREADARTQGRMARDYATVRLSEDARNTCYSYGLTPGTTVYDRCVTREIDARRRDEAYVPAPSYRPFTPPPVAYSSSNYSYPTSSYVEHTEAPSAGVGAFRDEYGFRYDGRGNRLDRYGNIISPQSTTP